MSLALGKYKRTVIYLKFFWYKVFEHFKKRNCVHEISQLAAGLLTPEIVHNGKIDYPSGGSKSL